MAKIASAVVISEQDNVATATRNIASGEKVMISFGSKTTELFVKDNIKASAGFHKQLFHSHRCSIR